MTPIRHTSLRETITNEIRKAILSGRYKPGERLVEDRLAEEFGVSRNPVREAMRVLEIEGLLEVAPRRGATVAKFTLEEAKEAIELRSSLEGLSARLAARRCSDQTRSRIFDLLGRGRRALDEQDWTALRALNDEFHQLIAKAGSNRFLWEFMHAMRAKTYWMAAGSKSWRGKDSWLEHEAILHAILSGDEELASLLASRHVASAGQAFMDGAEEAAGRSTGSGGGDAG
ncbi:DNA-binding GntR family transcriptional regulator [Natronocella acetinitrilica]|uniref:DNA-binding GntR family transcriptional regulator n=1 Tax=Natronocella acetinitrilica TaxID=414046 RepID=A0AAE3G5U0_9GAMM|nr:GntR family transcriptional regulator [Natronocella acetinitrilica]MCP1675668.1 DNA-binding GntR family transcriptional regulator [Natronocella acetinitrilica]